MKFLCPSCQALAEISAVRAEGTRIFFACSLCGVETAQETPAPQGAASPPSLTHPPARRAVTGDRLPLMPTPPMPSMPSASRTRTGERMAVGGGRLVPLRQPEQLAPETAHDPFFIPAGHCPKCLAEKGSSELACKKCGLLFANVGAVSFDPPEPIRGRWAALWVGWDDPVSHERFRQAAFAEDQVVHAGRLYQLRLTRLPGDAHAERGKAEVVRMVSSVAVLERSPGVDRRKIRMFTWGVIFVLVSGLAGLVVRALLAR